MLDWPRERRARAAGLAAWKAGDLDGAYRHFEAAVATGTHPWSWLRFARSAHQRGDTRLAQRALVRALALAPESPSVTVEVAHLLRAMERRDDATALADRFARVHPHDLTPALTAQRGRGGTNQVGHTDGEVPTGAALAALDDAWAAIDRDDAVTALDAAARAAVVAPGAPAVHLDVASALRALALDADATRAVQAVARGDAGALATVLGAALGRADAVTTARTTASALRSGHPGAVAAVDVALLEAAALATRDDARSTRDAWQLTAPYASVASTAFVLQLAADLFARGDLTLAHDAAAVVARRTPAPKRALELETQTARRLDVLARGIRIREGTTDLTYAGDANTVAYLLQNSLPYMSGGYATRTHGLLRALRERGRGMQALTRPGYPYNVVKDADAVVPPADVIDGVPYHRCGSRASSLTDYDAYAEEYAREVERFVREQRAGVLHAASFFWNGIVANQVKARLGIPSIYEVRGFGELTRISRDPSYEHTEGHALMVRLETDAVRGADAVITITGALRDDLLRRGIDPDKVIVVPNGVDTDRFVMRERDGELEARYGLAGKTVIGFAGTLFHYEGLDLLLRAVSDLRATRDDVHVLVVGNGASEAELRALTADLGLERTVTFTGRVPHDEVERYLSVIDVTPFPRRALPVCEMVSPLKPLESMATGKVVIASNVAALTEMVDDGRTGLLFEKESVADLTRVLDRVLGDADLRARLTAAGRKWVESERSWSTLSGRVNDLYDAVTAGRTSTRVAP